MCGRYLRQSDMQRIAEAFTSSCSQKHTEESGPMKTNHKLALAVLTGVSIGVAGAKAMHARQVTPPPVYVISEVDAMDLAGLQKYGENRRRWRLSMATITFSLAGGAKTQALDGEPPKGIVVIAFDSAEKGVAGMIRRPMRRSSRFG
jgi:hypothetical protein